MLVKELIEKLEELPEGLPVYYIDDGAYVGFNARRRWPAVEFEIREVTVQGAAAVVEVS